MLQFTSTKQFIELLIDEENSLATMWINNPRKLNCFSIEVLEDMLEAFRLLWSKSIWIVVIRAKPIPNRDHDQIMTTGSDISQLDPQFRRPKDYQTYLEQDMRVIQRYPGDVIAMVTGGVFGGGVQLSAVCDHVFGSSKAKFKIPAAEIALSYDAKGIEDINDRVGSIAVTKRMFTSPEMIFAERAFNLHLLDELWPDDELEKKTYDFAKEQMAKNSWICVATTKLVIWEMRKGGGSYESLARIESLRRLCYDSKDSKIGRVAFKEHNKPVYEKPDFKILDGIIKPF